MKGGYMKEELIPNKSYADFMLGEDIHKYLGNNRIYDFYPADKYTNNENYDFYHPEVSIWTENNKIVTIICYNTCYWQGKNLIGMQYKNFLDMVKVQPDNEDVIHVPESPYRGQNQKVYTFYALGLMVWVWRNRIRTVIISDGTLQE